MSISQTTHDSIQIAVSGNRGQPFIFPLPSGKGVFIGSAANCGVQLEGPDVSPIHCRIAFDGQSIQIHDWMSSNGTYLDGSKVDGETVASLGSAIQIGDYCLRLVDTVKIDSQRFESIGDSSSGHATSSSQCTVSGQSEFEGLRSCRTLSPSDLDVTNPFGQELGEFPWNEATKLEETIDLQKTWKLENQISTVAEELDTQENARLNAEDELNDEDEATETLPLPEHDECESELPSWSADAWESESSLSEWADQSANELTDRPNDDVWSSLDQPADTNHWESRIRDLIFEAEMSDQRICALEDLVLAAESAQAAQTEERQCLEAWLQDIERKFSSREDEHAAEVEQLKQTVEQKSLELHLLHERFASSNTTVGSNPDLVAMLEHLRTVNSQLEQQLHESRQQCRQLEQQISSVVEQQTEALRAELTELAVERAELARQRHDLVNQLAQASQPYTFKEATSEENEMACRLRALREHLREIHQQEQQDRSAMSFASRLTNLWHRVTN